jgi:hypothetical protein
MDNYNNFQNLVSELTFVSEKNYKDPFNEVKVFAEMQDPKGKSKKIPLFWAGKNIWKLRYSSNIIGKHKLITRCSGQIDNGLNNRQGTIEIKKYNGKNSLFKHGRVKVANNNKYLEHADGTPFFWLGDTWWFAFASRCKWPKSFKAITKDRLSKGFTVIQIVAGLYPDFGKEFNELEANEAGYAWDKEFKSVNPAYFDYADQKINWLVKSGLVPCIFGAWGYYLSFFGLEKMKKHWEYLIARWGSYPVIWSVAGEAKLPYYDKLNYPESKLEKIKEKQKEGWTEISKFIRKSDPFNNLITVHPSPGDGSFSSRDIFNDSSLFDIDMLQTGHSGTNSLDKTYEVVQRSVKSTPRKPVINGEVNYEGIMGSSLQDTQRFLFWTHILSGAAGHTYGADGIWTCRSKENYIGETGRWSTDTWEEAMDFPGSYQLGIAKKLLEKLDWSKFEVHPEWVIPHNDENNKFFPYCAGIPGKVRIIYIPGKYLLKNIFDVKEIKISGIEKDTKYDAYFFDPRKGEIFEKYEVEPDNDGQWSLPKYGFQACPSMEDWVMVLESV